VSAVASARAADNRMNLVLFIKPPCCCGLSVYVPGGIA
jgi:hypothetical protein